MVLHQSVGAEYEVKRVSRKRKRTGVWFSREKMNNRERVYVRTLREREWLALTDIEGTLIFFFFRGEIYSVKVCFVF